MLQRNQDFKPNQTKTPGLCLVFLNFGSNDLKICKNCPEIFSKFQSPIPIKWHIIVTTNYRTLETNHIIIREAIFHVCETNRMERLKIINTYRETL